MNRLVHHARILTSICLIHLPFAPAEAAAPPLPPNSAETKPESASPKSENSEAKEGPREFAPGVRIDWRDRHVALDATVTLREGALELLACSPRTREHESIFVVPARPLHIYQAMGLIGLEPGHPVQYDGKADRWVPPAGQKLTIEAHCPGESDKRTIPVERFVRSPKTMQSPDRLDWVFAGSQKGPDDRFGADHEGTVICVVDFDTALIALGSLHTADNEQLWLEANTDQIPPLGTQCELIIRAAEPAKFRELFFVVEVASDGVFRFQGRSGLAKDVAEAFRVAKAGNQNIRLSIVPTPLPQVSAELLDTLQRQLIEAGVPGDSIHIRPRRKPPPPP